MSGIGTLHRASRAELRGPHSVIERDRIALSVDLKGCAARLQQVGPTSA
jgi:hypothetical protein